MTENESQSPPSIRLRFGNRVVVVGEGVQEGPGGDAIRGPVLLVAQEGAAFERRFPQALVLFRDGPFLLVRRSSVPDLEDGNGYSVREVTASATVFERATATPSDQRPWADRVAGVDATRYCRALAQIASYSRANPTRFADAAEQIEELLPGSWSTKREPIEGRDDFNLVASRAKDGTPFYVACAHLDSRGDTKDTAWGADDNASGCAALLELAHVFGSGELQHGLKLVFFGSEEEDPGLIGSRAYVRQHEEELPLLLGVINLDTIARQTEKKPTALLNARDLEAAIIGDLTSAAATYVPQLIIAPTDAEICGDHLSFLDEGVPAVLAAEFDIGNSDRDGDHRVDIHTSADRAEFVDCELGVLVTQMVVGFLAERILGERREVVTS